MRRSGHRSAFGRAAASAALVVATVASFLAVTAPTASAAGPWFVDITRPNDSGSCLTPALACKTIQGAVTKAVAGDVINIANGTYPERVSVTKALTIQATNPGNVTINASATSASQGQAITVNIGAVPLRNVTISGVRLTGGYSLTAGGGGGGGLQNFNSGVTTLTDSTVNGNTGYYGGGILAFQGSVVLNNTTVTGNAAIFGGALTNYSGTTVINGGSLTSNTASAGGALATIAGTLSTNGTQIDGNSAGTGAGGGVVVSAGSTINVAGGSLNGNSAANGGGAYVIGKSVATASPFTVTPSGVLNLSGGVTVNANKALGGAVTNGGNGGGVFSAGVLNVDGASFDRNYATASSAGSLKGLGGQVFAGPADADDNPVSTLSDTVITNAGALPSGVTTNALVGGGIANTGNILAAANAVGGPMTLTNVTVDHQLAAAGAGIYSGPDLTLTSSSITNNTSSTANGGYGGGIYLAKNPVTAANPTLTVTNSVVNGNTAWLGGGIAGGSNTTVKVQGNSDVSSNTGVSAGGIVAQGALTVSDSSVTHNTVSVQGGGIYSAPIVAGDTPSLTLTNATVTDNTAANIGGGVIVGAPSSLTSTGGSISRNVAAAGGGVVLGDTVVSTIDSTDFVGNKATLNYGGAIFNAGTLTLGQSLLQGNTAASLGGAIFSGSGADNAVTKLTVNSSTFTDNSADSASALVTYSAGATPTNLASINRSTFTGNHTVTGFGVIENLHPLSINESTIVDNTSPAGGITGSPSIKTTGGLWSFALVGLSGSVLANNTGGNNNSNCIAFVVDGGYNHINAGDNGCGLSVANHDQAGPPVLGALAMNGGDTPTRLPGATSPLINKVQVNTAAASSLVDAVTGANVVLCATGAADQRGVSRPQGATCDIGAVEANLSAPTINGPSTSDYSIGLGHADAVFTTTGVPQPTLAISAGTLPAGLSFVDNGDGTGKITGTPTAGPGGNQVVTVTATNSAGSASTQYTIVLHEAPALAGPVADTFAIGVLDTTDPFHQTGGFPGATLSITAGTLPSGVGFVDNGDGTGQITGTPGVGTGGTYPVTITATNGTTPDATLNFTLTVTQGPTVAGPATATFQAGTTSSSGTYTTTGFPKPTLTATGLPSGLSLVDNGNGTGQITGNAAAGTGGTYAVVVKAHNSTGDATTPVTVTVNEKPSIAGSASVRFVTGVNGTFGYTTAGFPQSSLSKTGALPGGVSFVDNGDGTATLSGTPAGPGNFSIQITASNGIAPAATLTVAIEVVPPVVITTTALPAGQIGVAYSAQLQATGGQPSYSFSIVGGSLPAGLSLAANGTVSGTPLGPVANASFTVKVTDSLDPVQSSTKVVTLDIGKGPTTIVAQGLLLSSGGSGPLGIKLTIGTANATLRAGSPSVPFPGQTVVFKAGATTVCTAVTAADGSAHCVLSVTNTVLAVLAGGITANYAGSTVWLPSTDSAGIIS